MTRSVNWTTGVRHLDKIFLCSDQKLNIIKGAHFVGKTELLLQLAITCSLPRFSGDIFLGGHDVNVAYFDNGHRLSIPRLFELICGRLKSVSANVCRDSENHDLALLATNLDFDEIAKKCLMKIWVVQCRSKTQFLVSFASLARRMETLKRYDGDTVSSHLPWAVFIDGLETYQVKRKDYQILNFLQKWIATNPRHLVVCSSLYGIPFHDIALDGFNITTTIGSTKYKIDKTTGLQLTPLDP